MSFTLRAKRVFIGALTGAMALSLFPAGIASADTDDVCENAPDAGFADAGTTHADNINCLVAYGIAQGYNAEEFGTFDSLTRGQAATLFVNFAVVATDGAIADEVDEDLEVPFTDIQGATHEANIETMFQLGLIQGTTATTYSPGADITRAQFATILYNAHVALGVEFDDSYPNPFDDTEGSVHVDAISALAGEGIISGTTATTYNPSNPVTRGQTATLLMESAGLLDELGIWMADRLAAPVGPTPDNLTATEAPELLRVNRLTTPGVVEYIFDDVITGQALQTLEFTGVSQGDCDAVGARNFDDVTDTCFLYEDFLLYDKDGNAAWPYEAAIFTDRVRVRYAGSAANFGFMGDVDPAVNNGIVNNATRATARYNAVEDTARTPSIEGDFPLLAVEETAEETLLYEPQLVDVENYRLSPVSIDGQTRVLVDFVFDGPVGTQFQDGEDTGVDAGEFYLVGNASAEFQGLTFFTDGSIGPPNPTDTTVTVALADDPTQVPETSLRRGYVVMGDTDGQPDPKDLTGTDGNVLLSQPWEDTDGMTVDPDLVGAERVPGLVNRVKYTFDEAISDVVNEFDASEFHVYFGDGTVVSGASAFPTADPGDEASAMFVDFTPGDLPSFDEIAAAPVGAFVGDSAATATDSLATINNGRNRPASVSLPIPSPTADVDEFFGVTARPDLIDVVVAQNSVTLNYQVAFTFNEDVTGVVNDIAFDLYDANGTRFTIEGAVGGRSLQSGGERVVFSVDAGFSVLTNEQIEAGVKGAVQTADLQNLIDDNIAGTVVFPTEGQVCYSDQCS